MILDSTILVEYVGIFSVAIGLHIFKSAGDKIRILNSGGDMSPRPPHNRRLRLWLFTFSLPTRLDLLC
jgi:hypothetical protein